MNLTDRENVLVADAPESFADAMVEVYRSQEFWERISEAGVRITEATFSRATAEQTLRRLFADDGRRNLGRGEQSPSERVSLASV